MRAKLRLYYLDKLGSPYLDSEMWVRKMFSRSHALRSAQVFASRLDPMPALPLGQYSHQEQVAGTDAVS